MKNCENNIILVSNNPLFTVSAGDYSFGGGFEEIDCQGDGRRERSQRESEHRVESLLAKSHQDMSEENRYQQDESKGNGYQQGKSEENRYYQDEREENGYQQDKSEENRYYQDESEENRYQQDESEENGYYQDKGSKKSSRMEKSLKKIGRLDGDRINRGSQDKNRSNRGLLRGCKLVRCRVLKNVLIKSRDLIHQGGILITHPLAGGFKPGENPYRSIILQEGSGLDHYSLKIIETAIEKYEQFVGPQAVSRIRNLGDQERADYSRIDYELVREYLLCCDVPV